MSVYNLNTLLHRSFPWTINLPDGSRQHGDGVRDIPVRIPRIQRDYAEGRDTETIERKRYNLLNDMLDVIYGIKKELSFDFVYGYIMSNGTVVNGLSWQDSQTYPNVFFEPLDGQQRLTTLFLFYWLFGRGADLRKNDHSLFIYETRDTSEEFCHWLVKQDAEKVIKEWEVKVAYVKQQNTNNKSKWNTEKNSAGVVDSCANRLRYPLVPIPSLFRYMQSIDSFKWDWHDDPNIHSMIRVIESTVRYLQERDLSYTDGISCNANLDKITFMLLDNLVCDGDQLFEKMNARGKALTSFEILKSSLEEEMERQGLPKSNPQLTNDWRNSVDGNWIDFCWDSSDIGTNPQLKNIRSVEKKLERLLIRIAGKSFFQTDIVGTPPNNTDAIDYTELFKVSISSGDSVNKVIDRYLEYAQHERSVRNSKFSQMDFQCIFADIQNLIYKDSNRWYDASTLLPQLNRSDKRTLLDEFMVDSPTHNTRVMIYAMLAYLRIVPAKDIVRNPVEKSNFVDWMRFIRNVYNSDNKNSGLDNFTDVKTAIKAIDYWLAEYRAHYRTNDKQDILRLLLNYIKVNPYGQEQARLDEEVIKADLRISGNGSATAIDWETSILNAEDNFYLWGQIIAPLSWSYNNNIYDKKKFDSYIACLKKIFDGKMHDNEPIDALLIQAMLCYQDYRHNLKDGLGSLGRLNNNRDYSWKQYLRKEDPSTGYYGVLFKCIIDQWLINSSLSFEDLLKQEIAVNKGKYTIKDWQYYIVSITSPNVLMKIFNDIQTSGRYIYSEPGGHAYLFRSNTFRTSCRYEILTTYLNYETSLHQSGVKSSYLAHTAEEYGAYVDFTMPNGDIIRLSPVDGDLYKIEQQVARATSMAPLHQNIGVGDVETQLHNLGVIVHL